MTTVEVVGAIVGLIGTGLGSFVASMRRVNTTIGKGPEPLRDLVIELGGKLDGHADQLNRRIGAVELDVALLKKPQSVKAGDECH